MAERGDLAGWQMVEDDAVHDKHSQFAGTPVVDRRRCPAQALGQGMGGTQEVPLRWAAARTEHLSFFAVFVFFRCIRGFLLGRA